MKQQAFFPRGSRVLENSRGTAHGFLAEHAGKLWFILPGPPVELQGIWNDHIQPILLARLNAVDPLIVQTWDTLGRGESEVASRVEPILSGLSIVPGYRVHLPYCEVKLTYRASERLRFEGVVARIDAELSDITALRNEKKSTAILAELLKTKSFCLVDEISGGWFLKSLLAEENFLNHSFLFTNAWSDSFSHDYEICLHAKLTSETEALAGFTEMGKLREETFSSKMTHQNMPERRKQELIERACLYWIKSLRGQA